MADTGTHEFTEDERTGEYVLTETLYSETGGTVTRDWLSLSDQGRRLTDEWVQETVEDGLEVASEADRQAAALVEDAFLTGQLRKEIAVVTDDAVSAGEGLGDVGLAVDDVRAVTEREAQAGDPIALTRPEDPDPAAQLAAKRERIGAVRTLVEDGVVADQFRPRARYAVAAKCRRAGAFALAAEDADAREWFERAAIETMTALSERRKHLPEGRLDWESEPFLLRDALYTALLSGDAELVEAAATEADVDLLTEAYLDDYPQTEAWFHWVHALAAVVGAEAAGDPKDHLAELAGTYGGFDAPIRETFDGLDESLRGILEESEARVRNGIQTVLDAHEGLIDGDPTTGREVVSLHGTALVALARERGLRVGIMSRYLQLPAAIEG